MNTLPFSVFLKKKPVIGMLHLTALAGEPGHISVPSVIHHAQEDILALEHGGIDGILVENWRANGTTPFVAKQTAVCFTQVLQAIVPQIHIPWGINVLHNDYPLAFYLAQNYHADFVQLDVFVDAVRSAFFYSQDAKKHPFEIHPDPQKIQHCAQDAGNMPFIVFIQPKHYAMLEKDTSLVDSAKKAKRFGAAGVIVTKVTGVAPELKKIKILKHTLGSYPVGIGSGVTAQTVKQYVSVGDFCIVGTALKKNGNIDHSVDSTRVIQLMKHAHAEK